MAMLSIETSRMAQYAYWRCFMYSSKEGATEMDLRASSCSKAAGSRVSAIPPDPSLGPLNKAVETPCCWTGAKAEAPATSAAARTILD